MRAFAELFNQLDRTTSLNDKQAALARYLKSVPAADGAWAVALLSGRRPKKPLTSGEVKKALLQYLGIPAWMLDESYELVGDQGETIALLIDTLKPAVARDLAPDVPLSVWMEERLPSLAKLDETGRAEQLAQWWAVLDQQQVFLLQKLISGAFRVGVSQAQVLKAIAAVADLPLAVVTQRFTGKWLPTPEVFRDFFAPATEELGKDPSQPFPFALAYPLDTAELSPPEAWSAEWKWDGIRAQIIRRAGETWIWSRGEELVTAAFPELAAAALTAFPDGTVVDGEILAFAGDRPLGFAALQKRLGRKKVSTAVQKATPLKFFAYDLLEAGAEDYRDFGLAQRRQKLKELLDPAQDTFVQSESLPFQTWADLGALRDQARSRGVEGLMLKRLDSAYRAGRRRGDWWKWKVEPLVVDAVLLYAQAGSGRRANLFTDYSFAVWDGAGTLVPVAKAYSGLDQTEIAELDRWIRAHTKEKFGPVRSVEPFHVFELGFEGIQASSRHKAGLALRFPRILRWRKDKPAAEADTLQTLAGMLHGPT